MSESNEKPLWLEGPIPAERQRARASDYLVGQKLNRLLMELEPNSSVGQLYQWKNTGNDASAARSEAHEHLRNSYRLEHPSPSQGDDRMAQRAADFYGWLSAETARLRIEGEEERSSALAEVRQRLTHLIIDSGPTTVHAAKFLEEAIAARAPGKPSGAVPTSAMSPTDSISEVSSIVSPSGTESPPLSPMLSGVEPCPSAVMPSGTELHGHTGASAIEPAAHVLDEDDRQLRGPIAPLVEKAIEQTGSDKFAVVYAKLRQMALNSEPPFTGEIADSGDLRYTADDNTVRWFTKNALGGRLRRRRSPS